MFQKLTHFIKYHNALPIALSLILLSSGAVFAASPEVQEAILSKTTTTRSVDNSFIISTDLETRDTQLKIVSIKEDDDSYFVSYTYNTISIDNYVWKEFNTSDTLTVSKKLLNNRDLGLYVAEEISEVVSREDEFLKEVQAIETNKGVTVKVVTTEYSGLIGRLLKPEEEIFEGYVPLIPDEPKAVRATTTTTTVVVASSSRDEIRQIVQDVINELIADGSLVASSSSTTTSSGGTSTDTLPPTITILGNNPAETAIGSSYIDLGATVTDHVSNNIGIEFELNGIVVSSIHIDTSANATFTLRYSATDQAGNTGTAERIIIVGTGASSVSEETATTTPTTVTTETATTTPTASTTETATTTSSTTNTSTTTVSTTTTSTTTATTTSSI